MHAFIMAPRVGLAPACHGCPPTETTPARFSAGHVRPLLLLATLANGVASLTLCYAITTPHNGPWCHKGGTSPMVPGQAVSARPLFGGRRVLQHALEVTCISGSGGVSMLTLGVFDIKRAPWSFWHGNQLDTSPTRLRLFSLQREGKSGGSSSFPSR